MRPFRYRFVFFNYLFVLFSEFVSDDFQEDSVCFAVSSLRVHLLAFLQLMDVLLCLVYDAPPFD